MTHTHPSGGSTHTARHHPSRWRWGACALTLTLLCVGVGLVLAAWGYGRYYADRIYPGVTVYGIPLGGATVSEAAATLQADFPNLPLLVRDGEHTWPHTWADIGLRCDPEATAQLAYRVGRDGLPPRRMAERLRALLFGYPLPPVVLLPTREAAITALNALAPEIATPPQNATLIITADGVTPVPGRPGREPDIEATAAVLSAAIGVTSDGVVLDVLTRPVPPTVADPSPAQAQAERLLARPFLLIADDPLTGYRETWPIGRETLTEWLTPRLVEENGEARLTITARREPVQIYLDGLRSRLPPTVTLDIEHTIPAIQEAIETGTTQAPLSLRHPPQTYIVQPGDTLMSVAYAHGFPVWRLTEANPGIEPGDLKPGQIITIPSVDVLFPLPIVADRRILVDLSEQHLYAYEGDTLVYDFVCSTGIPSSPTVPGKFQILSKEENAYASSWDLWMPHFMGIYRAGPDFTNGIHGLPTLSSGVRLWEGVLGRPASYGCIVLGLDEAAALYEWAELGTLVIIQR